MTTCLPVISKFVNANTVDLTVKLATPPTRKRTDVCFGWGTDDTHAVQAAWDATNGVYRLIFPNGTYYVETSTSGETLTSGVMPSAYLEGIGKVIITSPNSLGDTSEINQIIKFATSCGRASVTNMTLKVLVLRCWYCSIF